MQIAFYIAGAVAVFSTVMMLTRMNAVHALLYLVVSLLAVAVVFFTEGAPLVAALEVIIYAGAIMVLFVFVVMMLNLGERAAATERQWQPGRGWIGPGVLAAILLAELAFLLFSGERIETEIGAVEPKQVGVVLFGPYVLGVEMASTLLLAGLAGAYRIGLHRAEKAEKKDDTDTDERRIDVGGNLVHAGSRRRDRET